jgi:hypothetical protein
MFKKSVEMVYRIGTKDRPRQIEPHIGIMLKPQNPLKLLIIIRFAMAERIGYQGKVIQN